MSPFENFPGKIFGQAIEAGLRPSFLAKVKWSLSIYGNYTEYGQLLPLSTLFLKAKPRLQWMFDLMCWCWSGKPQHRPDFEEILQIMESDIFKCLLLVEPLEVCSEQFVTSSCYRHRTVLKTVNNQRKQGLGAGHRRQVSGSDIAAQLGIEIPGSLRPPPQYSRQRRPTIDNPSQLQSLPSSFYMKNTQDLLKAHHMQESAKHKEKVPILDLFYGTSDGKIYWKDCDSNESTVSV